MKNKIRTLLMISSIIGIPALINHFIFKYAGTKHRARVRDLYYDWRFGEIRYTKSGEGKPLLLIHGIGAGCGLHEWDEVIEMLSKHYKVYALDLIGFGRSEKPGISYSPYLYIELINDFINNVIGEKVFVAASSNSAAYVAGAYNFMPNLYEKILLISPTGIGNEKNLPACGNKWIRGLLELPVFGTFFYNMLCSKVYVRYFLERFCFYDKDLVTCKLVNKYYESAHNGGPDAKYPVAAFMTGFLNVDAERFLHNIKIPLHVVWGDENDINPASNFKYVEKANSYATLTVIKNARLLPHYENSRLFYKICRKFFV